MLFRSVQLKNNSLLLRKVSGWKGLGIIKGSVGIDPLHHFAISVTYNDGFASPTWIRTNCVQAGLVFTYK